MKSGKKRNTWVVLGGLVVLLAASLFLAVKAPVTTRPDMKVAHASKVCMVNDTVMMKEMIPVEVGGKVYYGCCEGCAARLQNDRSLRYSRDPLTGREVDKAEAFIVASPGGTALYFESAETAEKYLSRRPGREG